MGNEFDLHHFYRSLGLMYRNVISSPVVLFTATCLQRPYNRIPSICQGILDYAVFGIPFQKLFPYLQLTLADLAGLKSTL
jgi:hypothetical protein